MNARMLRHATLRFLVLLGVTVVAAACERLADCVQHHLPCPESIFNAKQRLIEWSELASEYASTPMARLGLDRIYDHRSLKLSHCFLQWF